MKYTCHQESNSKLLINFHYCNYHYKYIKRKWSTRRSYNCWTAIIIYHQNSELKKWVEVNDDARGTYNANDQNQIQFQ